MKKILMAGVLLIIGAVFFEYGIEREQPYVGVVRDQLSIDVVEAAENELVLGEKIPLRFYDESGTLTEAVLAPKVDYETAGWNKRLTDKQYYILREKGTERAFTGALLENKESGVYSCAGCKLPLFSSDTKFKSGTGWPSFYAPIAEENVAEDRDETLGMVRVEVLCARCDGHLGHVFEDGPQPTGLRYCLNSESIGFTAQAAVNTLTAEAYAKSGGTVEDKGAVLPKATQDVALAEKAGEAKLVLAGGCFWCTEGIFESVDGVKSVVSGYIGGDPERADYKAVCTGTTGHAEAIEITYDPAKRSVGDLLRVFFSTHDPTTKDMQYPDRGTQYRSAVFYKDDAEKALTEAYIQQLNAAKAFDDPIVTTLEPLSEFYPAEAYHQDFLKQNSDHPYMKRWYPAKKAKLEKLLKAGL